MAGVKLLEGEGFPSETSNNSDSDSVTDYESDDEVDNEPVRPVLVPARGLDGQTPMLEVDQTGNVAPPSSVPLTMVANLRSAYNKTKNIKRTLNTLGLDLMIASETWERPRHDLTNLLQTPNHSILSYCRGREAPATRLDGQHAGKNYPGNTGGGAAIIYNKNTFEAIDTEFGVPAGVEAVWGVFAPRGLDVRFNKVKRICVGSVYIAPRSPFKDESINHIIETIHMTRARYSNDVHFIIAGDFNRVPVNEILQSYGGLQQICEVATRQGVALQLVLSDLHTFLHPATALPPLQVDDQAKGKDGDHQALILAPKASKEFKVEREKTVVNSRPMPESKVNDFMKELTEHKWDEVKNETNADLKTEMFHTYIRTLLDKHLPEKRVTMTNLDKPWMNPELKQLLRQVQRERLRNGKNGRFKKLWSKFRRLKRHRIKNQTQEVVEELKTTEPGKWYSKIKKLGGLDRHSRRLDVQSLRGLTDKECAEEVAESFAAVSQEYEKLDRERLPAFLPAGEPEQINIFQTVHAIKKLGKTKSTLPIDLPDKLRIECALDLAEPMTDIMNSCLRAGKFPKCWRQEWVTPVPKTAQPKTCKEVRKIASTSDFAKIFEKFLRKWIAEDIGSKININQFAGREGVGTEHLVVMLVDRVLQLLDTPGASAVVLGAIDWAGAFDRLDPTINVTKLINMGVRSSLIPVIIEFLEDRQMSVRYNGASSKWHTLVGGGPQGSWTGQNCYITASDDAAHWLEDENKFKYCDDLSILELIMVGNILVEYDFKQHVASDIGTDQKFLEPSKLRTQEDLNKLAKWTDDNLMKLNEAKTSYMIFSTGKESIATRLTANQKLIERQKAVKIVGVWFQEDGGWQRHVDETCKAAFARVSMLTKLKYAGVSRSDLIHIYKMFIRSKLEYCVVPMHSSLSSRQEAALERVQSVSLKIILRDEYTSYQQALETCSLETLSSRRQDRCLKFSLKCLGHPLNNRIFPQNPNQQNLLQTRKREPFKVNFAHTERYRKSAIPSCQRLLNQYMAEEEERRRKGGGEGEEEEERRRRGVG